MRRAVMTSLVMLGLIACGRDAPESGAALYAANCAVCHGADARGGGGGGVEGLSKTPPDLTRLAAGNGGVFPTERVLAALQGYGQDGQHWPRMAGMRALQSEGRDRLRIGGTRVRTTEPIAELLRYLDSVQAP
ncbi:cytochrome c [uncultured Roseobacter sp.]|uniref:c-type cytochrome n=1 Tax=uncultured Roseobacter sp. TaxID=114847 RepID=UPI0026247EA7|nr:cytochrome c [uncultured Roseobacter sp.]